MDIRSYLKQGRLLLFDGAMGTYFASLPGRAEERCEQACLDHPEEIRAIHRSYLEAGCRAIKANTFSVSADLAQGDADLAKELIGAACRLARVRSAQSAVAKWLNSPSASRPGRAAILAQASADSRVT